MGYFFYLVIDLALPFRCHSQDFWTGIVKKRHVIVVFSFKYFYVWFSFLVIVAYFVLQPVGKEWSAIG